MGGCRCTYRSCMVKSDGKTHMFHYPVFDKVRCHQWLTNAHRLEYLNLKVSQLKNRVVCQHHFKEQYFMNFKKEKLTFDAVPTEDGPYCDLSKWVDKSQEFNKLYPIVIEDIENDYFPIDNKKANFSIKYIDFLTNSESVETSYEKNDINMLSQTKSDNIVPYNFILGSNIDEKPQIVGETELKNDKLKSKIHNITKCQKQPTLIVPPYSENVNVDNTQKREFIEIDIPPEEKPQVKPKPKVRIISEKKITNPVPIMGDFKPVSPSVILNVSNLKRNRARKDVTLDTKPMQDPKSVLRPLDELEISPKTEIQKTKEPLPDVNIQTQESNEKIIKKYNNKEAKIQNLKNKLSPERAAAIKEKRKFNMKLKDVIESCVIKAEDPEEVNTPSIQPSEENKIVKASKSYNNSYFNNKGVFLASLEARMTRMENLLLNKIDQNTQRFMDLKKSIVTTTQKKRSISTQTVTSEEAHKRYLYSEISKYLSPESNNIIYQELFINKFGLKSTSQSLPGKRRKYR